MKNQFVNTAMILFLLGSIQVVSNENEGESGNKPWKKKNAIKERLRLARREAHLVDTIVSTMYELFSCGVPFKRRKSDTAFMIDMGVPTFANLIFFNKGPDTEKPFVGATGEVIGNFVTLVLLDILKEIGGSKVAQIKNLEEYGAEEFYCFTTAMARPFVKQKVWSWVSTNLVKCGFLQEVTGFSNKQTDDEPN